MAKVSKSALERHVETRIIQLELPRPLSEYKFHPDRRWRFDFAWPDIKLAIEIEGGTFGRVVYCHSCGARVKRRLKSGRLVDIREGGRHNTGIGFERDVEKYNAAVVRGWRVVRLTRKMIESEKAVRVIEDAYNYAIGEGR